MIRVRVPATTANLGPGFDALGLALALYDEVTAEPAEHGVTVAVSGEGAGELPPDERHLVAGAALATFAAAGAAAPGLRLSCVNRIPQARGLGSSAAAVVAGILIATASLPASTVDTADVLALAARLDGHADNVAACLLGGLTITWAEAGGHRAARLEPAGELRVAVYVPSQRAATSEARRLLPPTVPHADAAGTAGRAALLVHALTSDPTLLLPATRDCLHQPYRAAAMPESAALIDAFRRDGRAAVLSGAGPSVAVFGTDETLVTPAAAGWSVLRPAIDRIGAGVDVNAE